MVGRSRCCGITCIAIGCILILAAIFVMHVPKMAISSAIKDLVVVDESLLEDEDWLRPEPTTDVIVLFNITNLGEVLDGTESKLRLEEAHVHVNKTKYRYDASLSGDGNTYEFYSTNRYAALEDDENIDKDIIGLNPAYFGGVWQQAGGLPESQFFAGLSWAVVNNLDGFFEENLPGLFSFALLPLYLNTMNTIVTGAPQSYADGEIAQQWAYLSKEGGATIYDTWNSAGAPFSLMDGFEIASTAAALSMDFTTAEGQGYVNDLWNASFPLALASSDGASTWGALLRAMQDDAATAFASDAGVALVSHYGQLCTQTVATWLGALVVDAGYETITMQYGVQGVMSQANLHTSIASEMTTFARFSYSQFGANAAMDIMSAMGGMSPSMVSVIDMGVSQIDAQMKVAPEISVYGTQGMGGAFSALGYTLTPINAEKFLTTFSNQTLATDFIRASSQVAAGADSSLLLPFIDEGAAAQLEPFQDLGINTNSVNLVASFLGTYLPQQFLLRGSVLGYQRAGTAPYSSLVGTDAEFEPLDNGVGTLPSMPSSGLFTKRPCRDFIFGYIDALAVLAAGALGGEPARYNGIRGSAYPTFEAYLDANTTHDREVQKTGADELDDLKTYVVAQGMTGWTLATDVLHDDGEDGLLDCPPASVRPNCRVYESEFVITGLRDVTQLPPLSYGFCVGARDGDCEKDPLEEFSWYNRVGMKSETFTYQDVEYVSGLLTYRYEVKEGSWLPDPYYMQSHPHEQGFHSLAALRQGMPLVISYPYQSRCNETVYNSFIWPTGVNHSHVDELIEKYDMFINVEPYTGAAIRANFSVQLNAEIDSAVFNLPYWTNLFTEQEKLYIPLFWSYLDGEIEEDDANDLAEALYATQELFSLLQIVGCALGGMLVVGGVIDLFTRRDNLRKGTPMVSVAPKPMEK